MLGSGVHAEGIDDFFDLLGMGLLDVGHDLFFLEPRLAVPALDGLEVGAIELIMLVLLL